MSTAAPRVVSLLPSATEIVCAVGAGESLVGVSHECDHPSGVAGLPRLTRMRHELPRASGAIDRAVREVLEDALTVYELDTERLLAARPEVVVTQDLCDVCAVSLSDVEVALRELALADVEVVSLRPSRLAEVWNDVRRVGRALGRAAEGEAAAASYQHRCAQLASRALDAKSRPRVLTLEWLDPVMIGGTWMPELVELAGGEPLVTRPGEHSPALEPAALEALDPEVVLIKPCGFGLRRTAAELQLLERNLPWFGWTAVREGRVYVADGNSYFNRPGPRLVESLEILAACTHPELFHDLVVKHAAAFRRVASDLRLEEVA